MRKTTELFSTLFFINLRRESMMNEWHLRWRCSPMILRNSILQHTIILSFNISILGPPFFYPTPYPIHFSSIFFLYPPSLRAMGGITGTKTYLSNSSESDFSISSSLSFKSTFRLDFLSSLWLRFMSKEKILLFTFSSFPISRITLLGDFYILTITCYPSGGQYFLQS